MKISLGLVALILLPNFSFAQPLDVHGFEWRVIETEHYDVVYVETLEAEAQYVANSLEFLLSMHADALATTRNHRYSVVLYPNTMTVNGYVRIAPRMSAYYTTPTGNWVGDWLSILAVHEARHMVQFDALDRYTGRFLSRLAGEIGLLAPFASGPLWFYEGDAVMAETVLTETGRGRDPSFSAPLKALLLDGTPFTYNKMLMGSEKDEIPNLYAFGYLMFAYIRDVYDESAAQTFFTALAQYPFPVVGPAIAIRRATGKSAGEIYSEMAEYYGAFWSEQIRSMTFTETRRVFEPDSRFFTWYPRLVALDDGTLVVAVADAAGRRIVRVDDEGETLLSRSAPLNALSAGGGLVVWDEAVADVKFESSRTRIAVFDLESGRKSTIDGDGRYLYPAVSPDGRRIAALEWDGRVYTGRLVILDAQTGAVIETVAIPRGEFWFDFSWNPDATEIVFVASNKNGKAVIGISPETRATRTFIQFGPENIRHVRHTDDSVMYVSNYSGIDAVYAVTPSGERYSVVSRPIGVLSPVVTGSEIVFIEYADARGSIVAAASARPDAWVPIDDVTVIREEFFLPAAAGEIGAGMYVAEKVPTVEYESRPYSFARSGNRLHSWGVLPVELDPNPTARAFVMIDSIAGTTSQEIGLTYGSATSSLGLDYTLYHRVFRPDFYLRGETVFDGLGDTPTNTASLTLGLEYPIGARVFGNLSWLLAPSTSIGAAARFAADGTLLATDVSIRHGLSGSFSHGRWGVNAAAAYEYRPFAPDYSDYLGVRATGVSPGLLERDAFLAGVSYDRVGGPFSAVVSGPRGYGPINTTEMISGRAQYTVPLGYPDLAFGPLLYINRVSATGFYDHGVALDAGAMYRSLGAELRFHFKPLQLPADLDIAVRASWLVDAQRMQYEIIAIGFSIPVN